MQGYEIDPNKELFIICFSPRRFIKPELLLY